ncbi:MAG: hypothetical protein C3F07_11510 [Anaerolineales bacterium]|nr:hypothetical protein [Anaerolineae bacterium]PWB72560.1 MAG: hypothetical protein C3F07_11510 [Anaerolineales bacterium]
MNRPMSVGLLPMIRGTALKRGLIFGGIIFAALLGFEIFNFSSTSFALHDILGDLSFGPFKWSTILALAFCGIDFAGIARVFTPEQGRDEPAEVWYLLGAWFLAALFNASLTWWGVSVAILKHNAEGGILLGQATMTRTVPIFVAAMVLVIRVLLINTISVAGDRIFTLAEDRSQYQNRSSYRSNNEGYRAPNSSFPRPAPKPTPVAASRPLYNEPTYHPIGMNAQSQNDNTYTRT